MLKQEALGSCLHPSARLGRSPDDNAVTATSFRRARATVHGLIAKDESRRVRGDEPHPRPQPEGVCPMYSRRSKTSTRARRFPLMVAALAAASALVATPPARAAFLPLPATGAQVNDDPVNSIDPGQDAGVSDVTGGAVTAGKVPVPWATFEQKVAGGEQQIFVRAFKNGAWVTQGFPASLNIDAIEEAEAPSIDFAGAGRTGPWVAWYEPSATLGWPTNIFASRLNVAANPWLPSGQARGAHLPSVN